MFSTIRNFWSNWFSSGKQEQQHRRSPKRTRFPDDDPVLDYVFPKRRRLGTGNMFSLPCSSDDFLCPDRDYLMDKIMQPSTNNLPTGARSRTSIRMNRDRMQETKENIITIQVEESDRHSDKDFSQNGPTKKTPNCPGKEKEVIEWTPLKPFSKHDRFLCPNKTPVKVTETDSDVQFVKVVEPKVDGAARKEIGPIPYRRIAVMERPRDNRRPRTLHSVLKSISTPAMNLPKVAARCKSSVSESFRLEEKKKYHELLQKFTGLSSSPSPLILGGRLSDKRRFGFRDTAKSRRSTSVEVIDLSNTKDDEPSADSASSDIEVLESSIQKNEVMKKTKEDPMFDPGWSTELTMIYDHKTMDRVRKMEQEKLKLKLQSEESEKIISGFLEEQIQTHLRITEVALPEILIEDEEELKLPQLTGAMEAMVNNAFRRANENEVLVDCFGQHVTRRDLLTLSSSNWLNDEVINFYMNLLIERGKAGKYPKAYGFNTFFYPKLMQSGHASLKRWTRKVDIFAHDILIVPVHLGVHWCMAAIDLRNKTIRYFDSMGSSNDRCLQTLLQYLHDEKMDKKKERLNRTGWKLENVKKIPQQMNGSDCGVFACMYAEFLCRDAKINFTQKHMPYFRRKMAYEILSKKLML